MVGLSKEVNELQSRLIIAERGQSGIFEEIFGDNPKEIRAELAKVKGSLTVVNLSIKESEEQLKNLGGESKKFTESIANIENGLKSQIIALEQGEEAAFRFATAQQLSLRVGEELPLNIDSQISALFRLKKAKDDASRSEIERAKAEREAKAESNRVSSIGSRSASLGLTDTERVQQQLARDLELLNQAQELKIESEKSYEDRRVELRRQAEERIKSINEKATKDSIVNFEALENQIIGTFASVASGAQDGKTAIRSLAQSIVTQLIGALIKMGIQAVVGQTTAAASGAATAASLSAAYATPAALASLASFGANAAPAAAGIASTVGLAQGLSLAGGRQYGGPTTKGSNYRVNETGPEIYSQGGKDYLMNSGGGKVTPIDDMKGGQAVQVIVNNLPGQTAKVTETQNDDGRMRQIAIQVVSEQSSSVGSEMNRNINKNHNVTNRQGANRRN